MSDTDHHWVFRYIDGRSSMATIEACPLIIADDGSVEGIMVGLTLITDLESLKQRAWTITEVDDMEDPSDHRLVWAAEGHGVEYTEAEGG